MIPFFISVRLQRILIVVDIINARIRNFSRDCDCIHPLTHVAQQNTSATLAHLT